MLQLSRVLIMDGVPFSREEQRAHNALALLVPAVIADAPDERAPKNSGFGQRLHELRTMHPTRNAQKKGDAKKDEKTGDEKGDENKGSEKGDETKGSVVNA